MTTGGRAADEGVRATAGPLPSPEILRRRRHLTRHLLTYLAVNLLLVAGWLIAGVTSGAWFFWPVFLLVGWGLLLDVHALWAYGRPSRGDTGSRSAR